MHPFPRELFPRRPHQQRNVRHLPAQLVGSLEKLPVFAQHGAVVRHENDDGVFEQAEFADQAQQIPDPGIDAIHLSRVVGPEALLDGVREGNGVVRGFNVARAGGIGEVFLQKACRRIPRFVGVKEFDLQVKGALP